MFYYKTTINLEGQEFPCFFIDNRRNEFKAQAQAAGYKVYSLRHGDYGDLDPVTIERAVTVNFAGYLAVSDPKCIEIIEKGLDAEYEYIEIDDEILPIFDGEEIHADSFKG